MSPILVLYYSRGGATKQLAQHIATGIESQEIEAKLCTVPSIETIEQSESQPVADIGAPFVTLNDLKTCSGLAMGSPTRFGNMAAPLKHFIDSTSKEWLAGTLVNKPCCVFTSAGSMHGGQEATLLTMLLPLIHHGMVYCGIPYTEPALHDTQTGGTPYGVSHFGGQTTVPSNDEKQLCIAQGKRLALLAKAMHQSKFFS